MRESPCLKNEAESNGGGSLIPSSSLNTPTKASVYPTHMYAHRHTPHTHTKEKERKGQLRQVTNIYTTKKQQFFIFKIPRPFRHILCPNPYQNAKNESLFFLHILASVHIWIICKVHKIMKSTFSFFF